MRRQPRPDIAALIRKGHSDTSIASQLHAAKLTVAKQRRAMGVPPIDLSSPLTIDQKWATYAKPVDNGHVAWDGPHSTNGVPVFKWHGHRHQARGIAFRRRYGRDPIGYVRASCEYRWCVAEDHIADQPMRDQLNTAFTAIFGRTM